MKGKLVSFEKQIVNGVHNTFAGQKGTLYKFNVVLLSNGVEIKGTANSTKEQPNWAIGEEYTFEHTSTTTASGNTYHNINGMKKVDAFKPGGGKASSPQFMYQKLFEGALECTFKFFELNPDLKYSEDIEEQMINYMYNFIKSGSTDEKKWMNLSSLRLALMKFQARGTFDLKEGMKISSWLIETANAISTSMESVIASSINTNNSENGN